MVEAGEYLLNTTHSFVVLSISEEADLAVGLGAFLRDNGEDVEGVEARGSSLVFRQSLPISNEH